MPQELKLPLSHAEDLRRKVHKFMDNCLEHSEKTQGLTHTVIFCKQHRSLERDCGCLLWFPLYHLTSEKQQVVLWSSMKFSEERYCLSPNWDTTCVSLCQLFILQKEEHLSIWDYMSRLLDSADCVFRNEFSVRSWVPALLIITLVLIKVLRTLTLGDRPSLHYFFHVSKWSHWSGPCCKYTMAPHVHSGAFSLLYCL